MSNISWQRFNNMSVELEELMGSALKDSFKGQEGENEMGNNLTKASQILTTMSKICRVNSLLSKFNKGEEIKD